MKTYSHGGIQIMYNTEPSHQYSMNKEHFHDDYEVYFLSKGSCQFYINEKVYLLNGGSLAFVDGDEMHRAFSTNNESLARTVVRIKKTRLQKEFKELAKPFLTGGALTLDFHQQKEMEKLIGMIQKECKECAFLYHESIKSLVTKLFIDLSRLYNNPCQAENYHSSVVILDVINYINAHYNDKITLEGISKSCHISISHLTRLFKASTGYTVTEYINSLRIKKAAELINNTNLSISEIAQATGFPSFSYFGKTFFKHYGISPLKYRKQN